MVNFDYAVTLTSVPNYGKVKILFGLRDKEYKHDENGVFVIDVKEVKTRTQYKSLKKLLQDKGYI